VWIQLSRLGHVAGSFGGELSVRRPSCVIRALTAFALLDFGCAELFRQG
jgi:hypothetical protein